MEVTAWNNGAHRSSGAGYGLKVSGVDRDRYFKKEWETVLLTIPGETQPVEVNIAKESFWGATCRELISKEIGLWLRSEGYAPWPKGHPPKFQLKYLGSTTFRVEE